MSDDPRNDDPRQHPEDRSVEDFFARERAMAPILDGGESRWQRIVHQAGNQQAPWARYLLVAAAVIVVAGAIGWGLLRGGPALGPSAPPTAGVTTSSATQTTRPGTTPSATPSSPTRATPSTSPGAQGLVPVPASFRVRSLTTADNSHLYSLGTVRCSGGSCPALAGSADNGRTWHLVHTFPAWTAPSGQAPGLPANAGQLSDVRFASPSVGWVFGGAVLRTTDGGVTWQTYAHPGGDVLALETNGRDVVLASAPNCSAGTCHGAISVVRAPATAESASDVAGTIDGGAAVQGASIAWHSGHAYVSPVVTPKQGASSPQPVVVQPSGLQPAGPRACGNGQGSQIVAPAAGSTLFAICPNSGAAGHVGYAVQASTDGGTTWRAVSADRLVLVNAGRTSFAAADAAGLLAVSGGSPDLHGSMAVSGDGGATWARPASAPAVPSDGWAWVGAPGGPVYYALSADTSGGYWKSTDSGRTWSQVRVAGR